MGWRRRFAYTHGATATPVCHSVAFGYEDMQSWLAVANGQKAGYLYSRNANPTLSILEEKIRQLDGGEAATSFSIWYGCD
ncbi:PLP-dependent transferase [Vibrio sp. PP-XX7]